MLAALEMARPSISVDEVTQEEDQAHLLENIKEIAQQKEKILIHYKYVDLSLMLCLHVAALLCV